MEFQAFPKIESFRKVEMVITQKIHGTNAAIQILRTKKCVGEVPGYLSAEMAFKALESVMPEGVESVTLEPYSVSHNLVMAEYVEVRAQSRTRFIYPGDDNFGFAAWVEANKAELIEKLGSGIHYGEWAGPGINSGEGLKEKMFVLFDHWKFPAERPLPTGTAVVPVLYKGPFDLAKIEEVMADLKENGSKLVPGFLRPEGVVVQTMGTRLKKVFDPEDTKWRQPSKEKAPKLAGQDYSHLLQPIRLQKLLSRDQRYLVAYPESLSSIVKDYFQDLVDEGEVTGDEGQLAAIRKDASSQIFHFVKSLIKL